jgi:hypothetical protein
LFYILSACKIIAVHSQCIHPGNEVLRIVVHNTVSEFNHLKFFKFTIFMTMIMMMISITFTANRVLPGGGGSAIRHNTQIAHVT